MTATQPDPAQRDVWFAELGEPVGHEQAGARPAVVLSVDGLGRRGLAVVVPLTTTQRGWALHLTIDPPEGGLRQRSDAMPEMVRSISSLRLRQRWGRVRPMTHRELARRVQLLLAGAD